MLTLRGEPLALHYHNVLYHLYQDFTAPLPSLVQIIQFRSINIQEVNSMKITEETCFYPDSLIYSTPDQWGLEYEEFNVTTPDGEKLHCWHILPKKGSVERNTCVIHLHGNAQNMTAHVAGAIFLARAGYRLITFDYRGYGSSSGKSDLDSLVIDAGAVLDKLLSEPFNESENLFCFGQSMGGYTLARILPRFPQIKGAMIEAALISFHRLFADAYPMFQVDIPRREDLETLPGLRESKVPKLFIHGKADSVVPYAHTIEIYEAAREPKDMLILDGVGHIDALYTGEAKAYKRRIFDFLATRV